MTRITRVMLTSLVSRALLTPRRSPTAGAGWGDVRAGRKLALSAASLALALCTACTAPTADPPPARLQPLPKPLVIAHRGASGYLPEHTLEAYALAIGQGAHFIESDLVMTGDGVLLARHENELSDTTDVAEKYPERKTTMMIDGQRVDGWFSEDFTLAEIRNLRANQRFAFRDQSNNGKFGIPTLDEVIQLVLSKSRESGREVGIYLETKHPSHFAGHGLALENPLIAALQRHRLDRSDAAVFIQSFEVGNLKKLNGMTDVPLVQLLGAASLSPFDQQTAGTGLTYAAMSTDAGLGNIARYADGIGPWKGLVVPRDGEGNLGTPTDLVARAHAAGLVVHAYTFRSEAHYLAAAYDGDPGAEYRQFFALDIDGIFTDFPDAAIGATR